MNLYPRIVYMGTPYFAVPGLKKLVENNYHVVAVVTTPDKPAGRGLKLQSSAVKQAAIELGIPVLEPQNLKSDDFFECLKSFKPDIQIVVAFKKLPDRVWQLPPLGTFNLHASLLPQYRGAAPINWAIINGEQETGLTTFFINDKIDEGNLLLQTKIPITPEMTAGELHDIMLEPGAELILRTLEGILKKSIIPKKQEDQENLKSAPKIFKENCLIDWTKSATEVHNFVRGLSPSPGAYTILEIQNKPTIVKILKTKILENSIKIPPKILHVENKKQLIAGCADGALSIEKLMPEGKKEMTATEFLNGILNKTNLLKINS
ncbi:MAG: methionyl-tRNA formyltransferase [Thermaurantimonas sp.]|uniref:methionyl-tRNA formyltransferase n=1 Tax=Thermaurantimonas sp. TaxID=2681568 RepID=UPI00391B1A76